MVNPNEDSKNLLLDSVYMQIETIRYRVPKTNQEHRAVKKVMFSLVRISHSPVILSHCPKDGLVSLDFKNIGKLNSQIKH